MTYAAHDFDVPAETLADMQARHARYLRMADAFALNNDPANARIYEDEAAAEAARIGVRMREHAAARIDHDRHDIPVLLLPEAETDGTGAIVWMLIGIMAVVALVAWLVAGAADSGPFCPGADPAWLGLCEDAPRIGGAL